MAEEEGKKEERKSLHTAAEEGKVDLVGSFLDKGEDVNSENTHNKTCDTALRVNARSRRLL